MTDRSQLDAERAERLARLRDRRTATTPTATTPTTTTPTTTTPTTTTPVSATPPSTTAERRLPPPTVGISAGTGAAGPTRHARRRSPATNAKIVTVGASTTALLGMMAGYGIADGRTSEVSVEAAPDVAAPPASIPPAAPTTAPVSTAPPQVIVVLVDAASGRPISTTTGIGDLMLDQALATIAPGAPETSAPTPAVPVPVEAPTAVDLAVPVPPPPPQPQAAPAAPAPQPTPQPQATSSGS